MRRQFGLLNNSCNARIDISKVPLESTNLTEHETNHLSFHAVETVLKRAKTSMKLAYDYAFERGEFPKELDLTWWNGTFEIRRALLPVIDSQICSMNNLAALKYQGDWYISTGVSNYEADFFVTNFSRQFMHEYVNENFSRSLQGVQPKLEDTKRFVQATTVVTGKYFGREGAEYILRQGGFSPFDYYSPLGGVFRQNSAAIELANDAITVSNVAILALPMVMALIPAAFFTDIQVFALCMFTIATDVIGVLPFFIKGVEMIYATRSRSDVVSYHLGNETLGLVRVFAVKCEGVPKFRWLGVTFVIVAICTMMLGVGLEIFAWRAMKRRRKEGKQGPFYVGGDDDIPRDLDTYSKLM